MASRVGQARGCLTSSWGGNPEHPVRHCRRDYRRQRRVNAPANFAAGTVSSRRAVEHLTKITKITKKRLTKPTPEFFFAPLRLCVSPSFVREPCSASRK